ncbi:MAG: hypothetical protein H6Q73_763 [Firmicutes bacterium]|nr:hypothetical protein [Bacillota bacterium]
MSKEFTLDLAQDRAALKITKLTNNGKTRLKLLQMGITPGTKIEVLRHAPLADSLVICVRGSKLALRRNEAKEISVVEAE